MVGVACGTDSSVASGTDSRVVMSTVEASTQTKLTSQMIDDSAKAYKEQIQDMKSEMSENHQFDEKIFESNDELVKFYTGLPSYKVLKIIFDFCAPQVKRSTKLTQFQEMMLTVVKLRLNPPHKDLAYRFDLSVASVTRIFAESLSIMDVRLSFFI